MSTLAIVASAIGYVIFSCIVAGIYAAKRVSMNSHWHGEYYGAYNTKQKMHSHEKTLKSLEHIFVDHGGFFVGLLWPIVLAVIIVGSVIISPFWLAAQIAKRSALLMLTGSLKEKATE